LVFRSGAIVQAGCIIQDGAVIAAGAVVLPGSFVKANELWAGNPAAFIRATTDHDQELITKVNFYRKYLAIISPSSLNYVFRRWKLTRTSPRPTLLSILQAEPCT
jgi:hypothetical protein